MDDFNLNIPEGIISEQAILSLREFCIICDVEKGFIIEMVEIGIIEPEGKSISSWQFSLKQMLRFKKAQRLQKDLKLNLAGVALSLELLDELQTLRDHVKSLKKQLNLYRANT